VVTISTLLNKKKRFDIGKVFTAIILLIFSFSARTQTLCVGNDTTLCPGETVFIQNCNFGENGIFLDNSTPLFMGDDEYSQVIPIGFNFSFYGNTYNQCVIGTNGIISFDLAKANGYCSWDLTNSGGLPNNSNSDAKNSIMPAYHDLDPTPFASPQGQIVFQTIGNAPNRRFVVLYKNIMGYDGGGCTYLGLILNESSNTFEAHIGTKPVFVAWNNGLAIQGAENANGTVAHITPGRNNSQWTANNEAKIWTPTSANNTLSYTITATPYLDIFNLINGPMQWHNSLGQTFPYNGDLNITVQANSTIGYYLTASILYCGQVNILNSDTSWVSSLNISQETDSVSCPGGSDGTAFAEIIPAPAIANYLWNDPLAQITQTAVGLPAGIYTCIITGTHECQLSVEVFEIPGMIATVLNHLDVACGNDGSLEVGVTQGTAPYTYSWDNHVSTTEIADNLFSGPYTCTIVDDNGCTISISDTIYDPLPFHLDYITPNTTICPGETITLNALGFGGSQPYSYEWKHNGNIVGTSQELDVLSIGTTETYCVNITEFCGDDDSECTTISSFPESEPSAFPNIYSSCSPASFELTNTSTNPSIISTTDWNFGPNIASFSSLGVAPINPTFNVPGVYDLIISVNSVNGCVFVDTIDAIIEVLESPIANFQYSPNPVTIFESTVYLHNTSSSNVISWDWFSYGSFPSTSNDISPIVKFPEEIVSDYEVTLAVASANGCVDTITKIISVENEIIFYAPNSFTPDGDEFNQNWKPDILGLDIYNFDLYIFNRWGEMIWENHDPSMGWDGTYKGIIVPDGTYVWKALVSNPYDGEKEEFIGSINLIR